MMNRIIFDKHQFAFSTIRNSHEQHYNDSRWRIHLRYLVKLTRKLICQRPIETPITRKKEVEQICQPFQRYSSHVDKRAKRHITKISLRPFNFFETSKHTSLHLSTPLFLNKLYLTNFGSKFRNIEGVLSIE